MEFLSTLVGKVLDFTVAPVGRHLGYVLRYSSNIKELKENAEKLEATKKDVDRLVVTARNNNEEIKQIVLNWMVSVEDINQADGLYKTEGDTDTGCSHKSCPNLWLRYKLSRDAKKKASKVGELSNEGNNFGSVSAGKMRPSGIGIGGSSVVGEEFKSRESTMKEIMEALVDPAIHVIGLYGLSGVGKTTLAKQVAKKAEAEKLFDMVLFVEVKHSTIKEIQNQIADMVGLKFEIQSDSDKIRAGHLCPRLEQEKSLLIVLDDLWERLDFKEVGIPSAEEANTRHKFILTSRNATLLSDQMKCQRNFPVGLLSEEEAWVLFKGMAEIVEHSDDPDLMSKAFEVSQKCARLPVAIVAVARALTGNKNLGDWKDALLRLNSYSSRNVSGIEKVDSCIKWSYDYLKDELKSTFLLSAMFSQDPFITELFMYVVGLGFLGVHNMEAARNRLDAQVRQLKSSSLLLDSYSKDRFTIHDVVRDVALSIAFEKQHALVKRHEEADEWLNEYKPESCTAICLDQSDIEGLPEVFYGPKVEFFYLNSKDPKLTIPGNFFNGMQEVKVLSLSNMIFSSLPSSVSLLKKLTTLSLHSCTLEDIALVEHLKELKILNLSRSRIKQLPCEVGQLSCLKILNLSYCSQLEVIPPNVLSKLKKLEELYMKDSFDRWEAEGLNEGKERASLDELKHLQKLSALEIDIPDASILPKDLFSENSLERYNISVGRDFYDRKFSRKLFLRANNNISMEYGVFRLFESVEELTLENLNGIATLYQSHNIAQTFCKLQAIEVSRCDQLKSLFSVSMVQILSRLKRIKVSNCKSLEEIIAFVDEENVEKESTMNVIELRPLQSLTLSGLPMLTNFCFSNKVAFPVLETLSLVSVNWHDIWHMPTSTGSRIPIVEIVESSQMRTVFNESLPNRSFCNLKTLKVEKCDFLSKLMPLHFLKSLSNLEELEIRNCASLEVVFDFGEFSNYKEAHTFRLKTLRLSILTILEAVWSRGLQGIVSFQSLQKLEIRNCNKLEIFQAVDEKVFPKLEELELDGRPAKMTWNGEFRMYRSFTVKVLSLSKIYDKAATFPYGLFYGFPKLEQLNLHSSSFLVIFSCPKRPLDNDGRKAMSIKRFELSYMTKLKHIWDGKCQLDHVLQNVKALHVSSCQRLINLGPSSVSLENLRELDVAFCGELTNLLTSSTARTLVQLTSLKITYCQKMEEIVTNGEDAENEIVFEKLKKLTLDQLLSCRSFCCHNHNLNFPLLDEVIIKECPRFRIFCGGVITTPLLKGVKVGNGEIHWQSSLNNTIQQLFNEGLDNLDVKNDEYPELIDVWNGKLASGRYFTNLTSLVMDNCSFLSNHVIPSYILTSFVNLRKLEVRNCDSVEVVFDLEGLDIDKEAHTLQALRLWSLKIKHLPNLKYVWNKDPHTIHCFQRLSWMSACECENLKSIFPLSIARGLTDLRSLEIESCGIEVIVAENQTPTSTIHFVFPELWGLNLIKLPNLKNFYPQRHTIEWPELKRMDVRQCKKVKVFNWEEPEITEKEAEGGVENEQYPLFLFEKVLPQLWSLTLNQNYVKIIRNGQIQDIFNRVDSLTVDSFYEDEPLDFPYTFIERFPKLQSLKVSHSSFKSIFPCEGHLVPSSASFDHLYWLNVSGCHCLDYLSAMTAKSLVHLGSLEIEDCKIMEEIVTNKGEDVEDKIVFKKLKYMKLIDLPDLKSFSSQICTFEFPSLTDVTIRGCSKMKMFCPKVLVTPLLEDIKIEEDEERWEGDLNKTLEKLFLEKEGQDSLKS